MANKMNTRTVPIDIFRKALWEATLGKDGRMKVSKGLAVLNAPFRCTKYKEWAMGN